MRCHFKIFFFCIVMQIFFFAFTVIAGVTINIIYPEEGDTLYTGSSDSTFIFGHITAPRADLRINNFEVPVNSDGTFLAFIPVQGGVFTFTCKASLGQDSSTVKRTVTITHSFSSISADSLCFASNFLFPARNYELLPDDLLRVCFAGTPGCHATFSVQGLCQNIPMIESCPDMSYYWGESVFSRARPLRRRINCGIYTGACVLPSLSEARDRAIEFTLFNSKGDTIHTAAPGKLTLLSPVIPRIAELTSEITVLRTAPGKGYSLLLPQGVRVWISGRHGNYLRVRLAANEEAWIRESDVKMLPSGTSPPHGTVQVVRSEKQEWGTRIQVLTGVRVPYRIVQKVDPASYEIFFYGITSDTDWIRYDSQDRLVRSISWDQTAPEIYRITIELAQKQPWGFHPFYDQQDHFTIDIKKSPDIARWPHSPLKGISVIIDPGHGPDSGAVGPSGFKEKTANLLLAQELKKKLRRKGALVFLTRQGDEGIALATRSRVCALINADMVLSLHHNAIPDGINPFANHGTSTYFYHPQSAALAGVIQEKLLQKLKLLDFGLYFDNLAMCRISEMPSVLIEPAFLMYPAEEILIKSDRYRRNCSDALVEAIEEYLKKYSE